MTRKTLSLILLGTVLTAAPALPVFAQSGEVQTKQYEDGGVYEGTFKDGLQHGTGTYTLPNGYEYTGDWFEGEIRGQGRAKFPNGSVYEGAFAKGKPHGQGKITFSDGGTYEGTWEDQRHRRRLLRQRDALRGAVHQRHA